MIAKALIFLLFYLVSGIAIGQVSSDADSIIYSNDNRVLAQIFDEVKTDSSKVSEYRFYNQNGFFCLSLRYDNGDFYRFDDNVDLNRDIIFLADTFETGFINRIDNTDIESPVEALYRVLNTYYNPHELDSTILRYLDFLTQHFDSNIFDSDEKQEHLALYNSDTTAYEPWEETFNLTYHFPDLRRLYAQLHRLCITDLSGSDKKKNNDKIYFRLVTEKGGKIQELVCLSDLRPKNRASLYEELEQLKKTRLYPTRARGYAGQLKAIFYVDLKNEKITH
ncbi:hypothetical protein [Reichenbachiella versicolor]|uniref:hypothetical protein n=1 Tax=Reichenbachiella versicolor TaxID=1821036 RepID=UPI000D6DD205|nr:hypothetical protein [Reichenbachiella versicolor]